MSDDVASQAFKDVPETGVIYVTNEAQKRGFHYANDDWVNLGQGAPETGAIGDVEQPDVSMVIPSERHEYAPVAGLKALREAVAGFYNEVHRRDSSSKYTYENVCICSGGRLALTRIAAALGNVNVGHLIPDYTAYEELLNSFQSFHPIPSLLDPESGFALQPDVLEEEISGRGLGALLMSNPSNPTGAHASGESLERIVDLARRHSCCMIFDEFYSHYSYDADVSDSGGIVSASRYIEDVERDPVLIVDGLTKNWRKPGWRISWTLGPKNIIKKLASAGSFLDGGAPHPLQYAAVEMLDPKRVMQDALLLQRHFKRKRDIMLQGLKEMNIKVHSIPSGAFYCFGDLRDLPESLSDGISFFKRGLEQNVITVPGEFFDVNPGKRRFRNSRYVGYARFSYGPPLEKIKVGLDRLQDMISSA